MAFRLRAFFLHFLVSLVLAGSALAVIFFIWYPSPLHTAIGVSSVVLLLLGVDVTLGPLLTLLLAKKGKKGLVFDLSFVAFLQISAFIYGFVVVAEGRPVWLVFNKDRFDIVRAYELQNPYRERASVNYRQLSFLGPVWVAARPPADSAARYALLTEAVSLGIDLPQRPDLYLPLQDVADQLKNQVRPLAILSEFNDHHQVNEVLARWPEADGFVPMMAPARAMTVLINKKSASVIAIVELNPWH
ncbi:MAG: TfpX/TfpZ family type IV pilin accessory protein [Cellvibrio sp.]|uniref:TfpX/TfpZ family type IV pilin accessory protein n=1 Tax=Cellvibrio sp. TaxID=1965322 RepID=UPI0031AAD0CE